MRKGVTTLAFVTAVTAAAPTWAQHLSDSSQVHGFAGWADGRTDGNTYQLGTEGGSYDTVNSSLNLNATLGERLMIAAQAEWVMDYDFTTGESVDRDQNTFDLSDMVGGRLVVSAPVTGLGFGLSFYNGEPVGFGGLTEVFVNYGPEFSSLNEHSDLGLAVNYWFSPILVIKTEYHKVEGNRFAAPNWDNFRQISYGIEDTMKLIQVGAQFSF